MSSPSGKYRIFAHDQFIKRSFETVAVAFKIFVGGVFWETFALISGFSVHSVAYYFITGFGSGLGYFLAHISIYWVLHQKKYNPQKELIKGSILGLANFLGPGTIWQRVVNDADDWGWTFTEGFFYMWLISTIFFFVSTSIIRKIEEYVEYGDKFWSSIDPINITLWRDFCFAISLGLGDAFFMGTSALQFPSGNWLAPAFGIYANTSFIVAILLAGTSSLVGFLVSQIFQNIFFVDTWTDAETIPEYYAWLNEQQSYSEIPQPEAQF